MIIFCELQVACVMKKSEADRCISPVIFFVLFYVFLFAGSIEVSSKICISLQHLSGLVCMGYMSLSDKCYFVTNVTLKILLATLHWL